MSLTWTLSEELPLIDRSSTGSKGENIVNRERYSHICTQIYIIVSRRKRLSSIKAFVHTFLLLIC